MTTVTPHTEHGVHTEHDEEHERKSISEDELQSRGTTKATLAYPRFITSGRGIVMMKRRRKTKTFSTQITIMLKLNASKLSRTNSLKAISKKKLLSTEKRENNRGQTGLSVIRPNTMQRKYESKREEGGYKMDITVSKSIIVMFKDKH